MQVGPWSCGYSGARTAKKFDKFSMNGYLEGEVGMKKVILKLTADTMQKLGIGSILVGLFQGKSVGLWLGLAFLTGSYFLTIWEARS